MLRKIIFFIVALTIGFVMGCEKTISSDEAIRRLKGEYELIIGSNQQLPNTGLLNSTIEIKKNGKAIQTCIFRNGKVTKQTTNWTYVRGNIHFDTFKDCAGVFPVEWSKDSTAASLIVKFTSPLIILLDPDMNVFYQQK